MAMRNEREGRGALRRTARRAVEARERDRDAAAVELADDGR